MTTLTVTIDEQGVAVVVQHRGKNAARRADHRAGMRADIMATAWAVCERAGLSLQDIEQVVVDDQGGSFSGLRQAVSFANTAHWLYGCQVMQHGGRPSSAFLVPKYRSEPNISKQKTAT